VVGLTIFGGVMGFDLIMRLQTWITLVTGVFTVVFIALVAEKIHWHTVSAVHSGSGQAVVGALVFVMTGFGLGQRRRRLLAVPAPAVLRRGRDRLDHLRVLHRAGLPAGVRPAAGGLVEQPALDDRRRSDRGAGHPGSWSRSPSWPCSG
jgi:hypothetical protein